MYIFSAKCSLPEAVNGVYSDKCNIVEANGNEMVSSGVTECLFTCNDGYKVDGEDSKVITCDDGVLTELPDAECTG